MKNFAKGLVALGLIIALCNLNNNLETKRALKTLSVKTVDFSYKNKGYVKSIGRYVDVFTDTVNNHEECQKIADKVVIKTDKYYQNKIIEAIYINFYDSKGMKYKFIRVDI